MGNVTVVLKNTSLALFFSGCNHYKSIHFATAKIQLIFQTQQKSFTRPVFLKTQQAFSRLGLQASLSALTSPTFLGFTKAIRLAFPPSFRSFHFN